MIENQFLIEKKPVYSISPEFLDKIGKYLTHREPEDFKPFHEKCERIARILCRKINLEGLENIPAAGNIIAITNHPFHFDFVTLYEIFRIRPDLKILAKRSNLFDDGEKTFFLINKTDKKTEKEDTKRLRKYLEENGSILMMPWGSLDHQGLSFSPKQLAVSNVVSKTHCAKAKVLPIQIDVEFGDSGLFPIKKIDLKIKPPIPYSEYNPHLVEVVEKMFDSNVINNKYGFIENVK